MLPKIYRKYNECPPHLISKSCSLSLSPNKQNLSFGLPTAVKNLPQNTEKSKFPKINKQNVNPHDTNIKSKKIHSTHFRKHKEQSNGSSKIRELERSCRKVIKQKNQFGDDKFCDIIEMNGANTNAFFQVEKFGKEKSQLNENSNNSTKMSFKVSINSGISQNDSGVNISIKKIITILKPPHRYKTTMGIFKNCLILYGGLGCQKDLSWARLNYEQMKWDIFKGNTQKSYSYKPQTPIYGHTMVNYKDKLIIYGGIYTTETNETTIIKTPTMAIQQGERGPSRRKNHAAIVCGQYMVIHGGIQTKQTKSDFLLYHISQNKWSISVNANAPALSCHKMASTTDKKRLKTFFIFGGISQKGVCRNRLYSVRMFSEKQIKCEKIETVNPPAGRHSFCFQGISQNLLILYGGRQIEEESNSETVFEGVFNDIHLYNIESRIWARIQTKVKMEYCFGMASSSISGRVFIFGGSSSAQYCDASIYMLSLNTSPLQTNSSSIETNNFQSQYKIRFSNRALISKNLLND